VERRGFNEGLIGGPVRFRLKSLIAILPLPTGAAFSRHHVRAEASQMRDLLDSIETASLKGLRDRAAIAVMAYTFARVSAVVLLSREDYRFMGKRPQLRLQEKGGKEKLVWLHHEAEEFLDRYLEKAQITDAKAPLFQTLDKRHRLTGQGISRRDLLRAVKQRCADAGLPNTICNHTFRGTGITVFLQNGGSLEAAQDLANPLLVSRA
jgi:integrase/recombinase XerD